MQGLKILPLERADSSAVVDIFNYYIENTFAAYPEKRISHQEFEQHLQMSAGYPTGKILQNGKIAGFGMLRPFKAQEVFSHVAEATYFLRREYTGRGLGTSLLEFLENEAKQRDITHLLVSISSKNVGSLKFHEKIGFRQCGLFQGVGRKNDHTFDMIWMQKMIGKSGPIHEENNSAK